MCIYIYIYIYIYQYTHAHTHNACEYSSKSKALAAGLQSQKEYTFLIWKDTAKLCTRQIIPVYSPNNSTSVSKLLPV